MTVRVQVAVPVPTPHSRVGKLQEDMSSRQFGRYKQKREKREEASIQRAAGMGGASSGVSPNAVAQWYLTHVSCNCSSSNSISSCNCSCSCSQSRKEWIPKIIVIIGNSCVRRSISHLLQGAKDQESLSHMMRKKTLPHCTFRCQYGCTRGAGTRTCTTTACHKVQIHVEVEKCTRPCRSRVDHRGLHTEADWDGLLLEKTQPQCRYPQ
jgi:hypothetical protein